MVEHLSKEQKSVIEHFAKWALLEDNVVPFAVQFEEYRVGNMPSGAMFVVTPNASKLGIPRANNQPLLMKIGTVRKAREDHSIELDLLSQLPNLIQDHVLAMDSITIKNGVVLIVDAKDNDNKDIVVAIHLDQENNKCFINEIPSVYGKSNLSFWIQNTANAGLHFYPNERTAGWLTHSGLHLPEGLTNRLLSDYTKKAPVPEGMTEIKPGEAVPQQPSQAPVTPAQNNEAAKRSAQAQGRTASQPSQDINKKR